MKNRQRKPKGSTKSANNKPKPSHSAFFNLEYLDEEAERLPAVTKHGAEAPDDDLTDQPGLEAICVHPSNNDCPEVDLYDDCVSSEAPVDLPVLLDGTSQVKTDEDEDLELQAMFYLPEWGSASPPSSAKLRPGREESLKVILANVADLLSRFPPPMIEDLEAEVAAPSLHLSPQQPHQPFHVSFTLDVDDDDDDDEEMMSDANGAPPRAHLVGPSVGEEKSQTYPDGSRLEWQQSTSGGGMAAASPTWDEVFGEEELNTYRDNVNDSKNADAAKGADGEIKGRSESVTGEEASCWEDVRDEEMPDSADGGAGDVVDPQMDNSMDLFGDDEAFLHMTIPDISTPWTSPGAGDIANSTKSKSLHMHTPTSSCGVTRSSEGTHRLTSVRTDLALTDPVSHYPHAKIKPRDTSAQTATKAECNTHTAATNSATADREPPSVKQNSFNSSRDYFSVNFDLGYSLEDSEEEREEDDVPAQSTSTTLLPKIQADPLTPYNSVHRARMAQQSSESRISTPQMVSELRRREMLNKGGALPSPITPPGARPTTSLGPARPRTPSSLSCLKRRRLDSHMIDEERAPGVEKVTHLGSVCAPDSPPHPGVFTLQEMGFFLELRMSVFCPAPDPLPVPPPVCQWSATATVRMKL